MVNKINDDQETRVAFNTSLKANFQSIIDYADEINVSMPANRGNTLA